MTKLYIIIVSINFYYYSKQKNNFITSEIKKPDTI